MSKDNELYRYDEGFTDAIRLVKELFDIYCITESEKKFIAPIRANLRVAERGRSDVDKFVELILKKETE